MADIRRQNPWKGLNFYTEGEIIYGRNVEILSLSQYIFNNTQTILFGRSGIGKSSILNAGIFPMARQNGMTPISIRLKHGDINDYLEQIKEAIALGGLIAKELTPAINGEENECLWEYIHRHTFLNENGEKSIPLLVFDQFEEIFTLQTNELIKREFFKQLGNLLNDVKPSYIVEHERQHRQQLDLSKETKIVSSGAFKGINIKLNVRKSETSQPITNKYVERPEYHIVFALREDFLSSLELYVASIPVMKDNRFGLLPLNEEQAADIIRFPQPGLVDDKVTKLIIEQVTGRTDFILDGIPEIEVDAAVLSLYLSRLYIKKSESDQCITAELVKSSSGHIIHDFYVEAITSDTEKGEVLSENTIEILEDNLLTGEGRRNNVSRSDLIALGVKESELNLLIENRKLLRQFHHGNDIRVELIHDILCPVVKERKEQREIIHRQEEERKRQEEEKLKIQEEAERKRREIEEKAQREKDAMEAESIRVKKQNKNRLLALSSIIAFIMLSFGIYLYCFETPYSEEYGNFTTKDGWPVGLGSQLNTLKDKEDYTVYYKLSRKGRLSSFMGKSRPFAKVEILNWKGNPSPNVLMESPLVRQIDKELDDAKASEFASLMSKIAYWQYTPDASGSISMKTAFDINGQELFSEKFSSTNHNDKSSKYVLWSVFYDNKGNPLQISDNGIDRIRYTVSDGFISGCSFFTILGTPQSNTSGVYGYSYEVNPHSANIVSEYELDKFGNRIDSSLIRYSNFINGRYTTTNEYTVEYSKQHVIRKYDGYNDTIRISANMFTDLISVNLNDSNRIHIKYYSPTKLLEKKITSRDSIVYSANYYYSSVLDSIIICNPKTDSKIYTERYSYPNKNIIEKSFWKNGGKINQSIGSDYICCHKIITNTSIQNSDSIIIQSFYDCNEALTKTGLYSKSEIIYDINSGNVLYEYYYNSDGDICKSEMFTYNEYGIKESRSVAGIDKTPVRCPNWDWDGYAYYKMAFLRDFTNHRFVAIMGINEFGDKSFIEKDDSLFSIYELPLQFTDSEERSSNIILKTLSLNLSQSSYEPLKNRKSIPYFHVLSKESTLYKAKGGDNKFWRNGIFDNDIPLKIGNWHLGGSRVQLDNELKEIERKGGEIQILRYTDNKYVILSFTVMPGVLHAEIHDIYLNDKEYSNIKTYIK